MKQNKTLFLHECFFLSFKTKKHQNRYWFKKFYSMICFKHVNDKITMSKLDVYRSHAYAFGAALFEGLYMVPRNPGRWLLFCKRTFHFQRKCFQYGRILSHSFKLSYFVLIIFTYPYISTIKHDLMMMHSIILTENNCLLVIIDLKL